MSTSKQTSKSSAQMSKLSDRAAQAKKNIDATKTKSQADLKAQAKAARESADAHAAKLKKGTPTPPPPRQRHTALTPRLRPRIRGVT